MTNDIRQSTANVDGARIIAADAEPQNWLSHGRTYDEQRFSPLKQINEDTIDDPELNLLYIGVGNGAPWTRVSRSPGGGDNLFLSSIVAVDADTGKMAWYYQTTPGDNWDYTAVQQMILADIVLDGKARKVIMQAPKNGFFYVLDRITGEFLSAKTFVPITWASHVNPETGRPVENPDATYTDKPKIVKPGPAGGHNWHPMS